MAVDDSRASDREREHEFTQANDHALRKQLTSQTREDMRRLVILERKAEMIRRGHK